MYRGTYRPGENIDFLFTTVNSSGAPTSLSAGSVAVYIGNSTTETTAGVTLTADFDAHIGLNHVRVATSAASATYVEGSQLHIVLTGGSVGGQSVAGYVVAHCDLRLPTLADFLLSRSASLSDSAANPYSLYSIIMGLLENAVSGSTWTIYQSDGTTTHMTRGLTLASAGSIVTGVT